MKKILVIVYCIIGLITSVDIILSSFFDIGVLPDNNIILWYLILYLFENELKDFPKDILQNKLVKYPMYICLSLYVLAHFSII